MSHQTIGILGGMGPYASLRCYELLLETSRKYSHEQRNHDYPHILIDNIPVRELTDSTESVDETVGLVRREYLRLADAGMTTCIMACNTMHLYAERIFDETKGIKNLSLIDETVSFLEKRGERSVGILGSLNTVRSGFYSHALMDRGMRGIALSDEKLLQAINDIIIKVIGGMKHPDTFDRAILEDAILELKRQGVTSIILGCTELPIIYADIDSAIPLYDPLLITIEKACEQYYANT